MGARETFLDLAARGIRIVVQDGRLLVTPASALTDDDRQAIRQHRDELLALLAAGSELDADPCAAGATDAGVPHPFARERLRRWTPAAEREIARMAAVHARALSLGLAPQQADVAADVAHWAARLGDSRPCIACAHLRAGASSRWWCAAQRQPLPQQLVVQPHRCARFAETDTTEGRTR